jgi:hypothetical protein
MHRPAKDSSHRDVAERMSPTTSVQQRSWAVGGMTAGLMSRHVSGIGLLRDTIFALWLPQGGKPASLHRCRLG